MQVMFCNDTEAFQIMEKDFNCFLAIYSVIIADLKYSITANRN